MKKKIIYILGILALGFVIFNNVIQTAQIIRTNSDLITGLFLALFGSLIYGIINIK